MSSEGKYIQLKTLDDLIKIVAGSPTAFIQHFPHDKKQIYFVNVIFHTGGSLVYFVVQDEKIDKKFITFNKVNGTIDFRDDIRLDANLAFIPIIEIQKQNVLPPDLIK